MRALVESLILRWQFDFELACFGRAILSEGPFAIREGASLIVFTRAFVA